MTLSLTCGLDRSAWQPCCAYGTLLLLQRPCCRFSFGCCRMPTCSSALLSPVGLRGGYTNFVSIRGIHFRLFLPLALSGRPLGRSVSGLDFYIGRNNQSRRTTLVVRSCIFNYKHCALHSDTSHLLGACDYNVNNLSYKLLT